MTLWKDQQEDFFNVYVLKIIHGIYRAINNNSCDRSYNLNISKTGIERWTIKVVRLVPDWETNNIKSLEKLRNK